MSHASSTAPPLPLVVQVGFSGSRHLIPKDSSWTEKQKASFHTHLDEQLTAFLKDLPSQLGLSAPDHFLCGISQIAIGGDAAFTRACAALRIPQRLFLPQHREEYLRADGSAGPDFSPQEIATARELLASSHIIQERIVSDAPDRENRFHDAQLELLRVSDVVICLLAPGAPKATDSPNPLATGTQGLIDLALKNQRPVAILRLTIEDHLPRLDAVWKHEKRFKPPVLPHELTGVHLPGSTTGIPKIATYTEALLESGSNIADSKRNLFKYAAVFIIGFHLLATICAVVALVLYFKDPTDPTVHLLLYMELAFLVSGLGVHVYLHISHACKVWAVSRVAAEIARSVQAFARHHVYLSHLFQLPFHRGLRPLLRTLNVLHLRSSSRRDAENWKARRDSYLRTRLTGADGQISYYKRTHANAHCGLRAARAVFYLCSGFAFLCTVLKLAHFQPTEWFGAFAIVLPVLAVGGLSLAAAFDLEARHNTSEEMLADLEILENALTVASSEREFTRLLLETEARLLGETANWFSRRSFTGVA
ncbi:MAG: hypothetical protein V4689_11850 [Verrucomicrobiota bacterium]